ncbi:hypothetical protein F5B20DRAFT_546612 [Whalleya microplaca]|nr:hypothetical protein F5B20DRAFT_546612 [Whalleya microplaca]
MANAQLMQEELQQSVVLSEEDAEFEVDIANDTMMVDNDVTTSAGHASPSEPHVPSIPQLDPQVDDDGVGQDAEEGAITNQEDRDLVDDDGPQGEKDDDLEDIPDEEDEADQDDEQPSSEDGDVHDDDDVFEMDAEGEEDEEVVTRPQIDQDTISGDEEDAEQDAAEDDDEDENEGVGAVKIKPGETDESDSEDNISLASGLASGESDGESVAEWEEALVNDEEDDDSSEVSDRNNCTFCEKDEEHDPGEDFEAYLTCKRCSVHAHQQCAREHDALDDHNGPSNWKCLECINDDEASGSEPDLDHENAEGAHTLELNGDVDVEDDGLSPTSARRSSAPKLARDLLPSQRGMNKPDSHSVFNQLVLDEDPMDGSRVLRKRKTSSTEPEVEADADEEMMSLRKRRRNTSDELAAQDEDREKANGAETLTRPRLVRSSRLKATNQAALCTIVKQSRSCLEVKMRVNATELRRVLSQIPKSHRKRSGRTGTSRSSRHTTSTRAAAVVDPAPMAPFFASSYSQPFYSFYDKETDELRSKPYGGILNEEQADTSKTLPTKEDRRRFDEAKQKAEEEWRNRLLAMQAEAEVPVRRSRKASGPASQIECIEFGGWEIDTWYAAPYPEEYSRNRVLFICEFCLKYMNSDYVAWRHKLKCPAKHPPGDEIYRHGSISFFEVDGRKNPVYCQNLCLLAKLFLGSKTLYYDVEPFLFYVLCEYDDLGYHFVGYFSKEKRASSQNNVSCILTLPIHQRKGYGHLLIDFSYLLTRVEEKTGSPEKPLSDMGLVSYRNYWRLVLCKYLIDIMPEDKSQKKGVSIREISDDTGMTPDDVISALEALRFLVRDPVTHIYAFRVDLPYCRKEVEKWEAKGYVKLHPKDLTWVPYVMGRSNATNFELGPALNTIAPREEDEDVKAVQTLAESGIATGDFAVSRVMNQKPPAEAEPAVLESTEPNDNAVVDSKENLKTNGIAKENTEASEESQGHLRTSAEAVGNTTEDEDSWWKPYENIPPSRFQVFPPITNRKPAASRMSSTISRPPLPRIPPVTPRPASRPKARRSAGGSTARKSTQKKTSSAKRKPGGTGRGPGRWPKGTKKSDYGNADSGPGLPPAWLEREKSRLTMLAASKTGEDNETQDTVQVQVKEAKGQKGKGKQSETIAARFEVNEDSGKGKGKAIQLGGTGANEAIAGADGENHGGGMSGTRNEEEDIDAEAEEE